IRHLKPQIRRVVHQSINLQQIYYQGFVVNERERLWRYTDHTISETAFEMEFADPLYFVNYFKKIGRIYAENFPVRKCLMPYIFLLYYDFLNLYDICSG